MPDRNPKPCRVPATSTRRRSRPPNPTSFCTLRRAKPQKHLRILSRSASEPVLWTVRFVSKGGEGDGIGESLFLPRPHTLTDVFSSSPLLLSPSPSRSDFKEEAKVVVSVTVEGSPGPVRAMVRLGDSVEEAIGVVVDKYGKEGRSPRLDRMAADSFQLHHSHFSFQSLNKSDKIGEVGGRSFYLRKNCDGNSFNFGSEGRDKIGGSEIELLDGRLHAVAPPTHLFFSFIARRLSKIRRRTKKLWKVVVCITCG